MRVAIAAIGRLKDGPERELFQRYSKRFDDSGRAIALGPLKLSEMMESRAQGVDQRKTEEAKLLLEAAREADVIVALHETGKQLTSEAFAAYLGEKRDGGGRAIAFLIGGPDGHGSAALTAAHMKLSLGAMTLPHGLARIVLAEQLYRAVTILSGHPYHRG